MQNAHTCGLAAARGQNVAVKAGAGSSSRWIHEIVRVFALLIAALGGRTSLGQIDYNHDCSSNFYDSIQFMDDYQAGRASADLNLDGTVNMSDYSGFAESRAKPQFTYYWMVTTGLQGNQSMDTLTDLSGIPLNRNCAVVYEQDFPKIPVRFGPNGEHLSAGMYMLLQDQQGGYTNWLGNFTAWMLAHSQTAAQAFNNRVPVGFAGTVCLDLEEVPPLWEFSWGAQTQRDRWREAVSTINQVLLDPLFLSTVGYDAPLGALSWGDLNADEQDELLRVSYNYFGVDFFRQTLAFSKLARPQAKFGFYGTPFNWWPTYDAEKSAVNDQLQPLWAQVDVLMPSVYQLYWTATSPAGSPCSDMVNSPGQNSAFFASLLGESLRVQSVFCRPGTKVIAVAWWHYRAASAGCSPEVNPDLLVNDTNVTHQLWLPWYYGADGLAIWGHYSMPQNNPHPWLDTPDEIGADVRTRWAPLIQRLACPR